MFTKTKSILWLVILILVILYGVFSIGRKFSRQSEWQKYTSNDGSYSILFPISPTEIVLPTNTSFGQIDTYHARLDFDDFVYEVSFNDLPATVVQSTSPDSLLDSTRDYIIDNINGSLLSEKDISLQGYSGKEMTIKIKSTKYPSLIATRIYLVGTRMYAIYFAPLAEQESDFNSQKFFNSFILN
jgi:hypothetical protein